MYPNALKLFLLTVPNFSICITPQIEGGVFTCSNLLPAWFSLWLELKLNTYFLYV